jgi:hypothetical protein
MPSPWPKTPPTETDRARYADSAPVAYWLDAVAPRQPLAPPADREEADLCILGGGFTGPWAALSRQGR